MAGAGAVVLVPDAAADASSISGSSAQAKSIDRNFVAGRVAQVDGTAVTVVDADGHLRPMAVTSGSRVWKRGEVDGSSLAIGDGLYARG
jgi:hypothetical protein